jgi:hypothetical protein
VQKYSLFEYQFNCSREHDLLHVPARLYHSRSGIRMVHRDHVLRDDRPGIEIVSNDMRGRSDNLDAPLVSLVIRFGSDESRKKMSGGY